MSHYPEKNNMPQPQPGGYSPYGHQQQPATAPYPPGAELQAGYAPPPGVVIGFQPPAAQGAGYPPPQAHGAPYPAPPSNGAGYPPPQGQGVSCGSHVVVRLGWLIVSLITTNILQITNKYITRSCSVVRFELCEHCFFFIIKSIQFLFDFIK